MIENKGCPLRLTTQGNLVSCDLSNCAWYYKKKCICSVLEIAESLGKELDDE